MAEPEQPESRRSGASPAELGRQYDEHVTPGGGEPRGPLPEDNRPGHHPAVEQDKPVERYAAKARELAEEAHQAHAGAAEVPTAAEVPSAAEVPTAAAGPSGTEHERGPEAVRPAATGHVAVPPTGGGHVAGRPIAAHGGNPLVAPAHAAWDLVRNDAAPLVAVPPLAALDALRQPDPVWEEINESKTGWLARIVLLPFVGAWRYATGVRPRLEGAAVALRLRGG